MLAQLAAPRRPLEGIAFCVCCCIQLLAGKRAIDKRDILFSYRKGLKPCLERTAFALVVTVGAPVISTDDSPQQNAIPLHPDVLAFEHMVARFLLVSRQRREHRL